jgi:hypothetical protein
MLHILSLEDDSYSHQKFDTLYKDGQSFHRLSNSTFLSQSKCYIHAHPSDLITHVINEQCTQHQPYHDLMCLRLERNK